MITGIGGQGVQLAAQVIARAAILDGRNVSTLGIYGGTMRGGNTDSTVIVADGPIEAPPIISHAWSAIGLHDEYWLPVEQKLRADAVVLVNDATFTREIAADADVYRVRATETAQELGAPLAVSMVMCGAFSALTGLVGLDALIEGMRASLPPYRAQHIASNEQAIRAGAELVPAGACPAWTEVDAAAATALTARG